MTRKLLRTGRLSRVSRALRSCFAMARIDGRWLACGAPLRGRACVVSLVAFLSAGVLACPSRSVPHDPSHHPTAADATLPSATSAGSTAAPPAPSASAPLGSADAKDRIRPAAGLASETVDFSSCPTVHDDSHGEGGVVRCVLGSGLVAQQDGSACFDVNRLEDDKGESLFTSEMIEPKGTVFVTDGKFELHRCQGVPYAVLQGGQLFPEGVSASSHCHKKKRLRRTYLLQDIQNSKRYDDISLDRAKELLAQIARTTKCNPTAP